MSGRAAIRVLLVDDHPLLIDGLTVALDVPGIEVLGSASTAGDAIAEARHLEPDVVVMDINLPDASGIVATQRIREAVPHAAVLVLTMLEDPDTLVTALAAGARGYVVKGADRDELLRAVRAVAEGELVVGKGVAHHLLQRVADGAATDSPFPDLTPRERQVLALLASGANNSSIGKELGVSHKTVANHVSNILSKLHVTDRTQAALRARDAGL